MIEIKLPIESKNDFKDALRNFKNSHKEYIQALKNIGFEYTTDLDDMKKRFAEAAFQASLEQDISLQIRQKGFSDFEEFKHTIIEERHLYRNDALSNHHKNYMENLNQLKQYIPDYDLTEEYLIHFYTFEGCEFQKLLKLHIEGFFVFEKIMALTAVPYAPSEKWTNKGLENYIFYHPGYPVLSKEPTLKKDIPANPNRPEFHRIIEE
jgi:hypothetical protein